MEEYVMTAAVEIFKTLGGLTICLSTLYFTIYGFMIVAGSVQHSMNDFIKRALIITVVLGLAFAENMYQDKVVYLTNEFEKVLIATIPAPVPNSEPTQVTPDGVIAILDSTFTSGMLKASQAIDLSTQNKDQTTLGMFYSEFGCGVILAVSSMILPLYCAIYLFMAKIAMSLLLAIGPIFIVCSVFPPVKRYFDKWFSLLCTYVLTYVLMTVISYFVLSLFAAVVMEITISEGATNFILVAIQTAVISIFLVAIVFQVPSIASGLCGSGGILNPSSAFYATTSPAQTAAGSMGGLQKGKMASISPGTSAGKGLTSATQGAQTESAGGFASNAAYTSRGLGNKGWDA
jgi:type IV secretion system protein VirB6